MRAIGRRFTAVRRHGPTSPAPHNAYSTADHTTTMMMKALMVAALFGAAAAPAGDCADGTAMNAADPDGTEDA